MGINLKIEQFHNELVNCINNSGLPSGVIRLELSQIMAAVESEHAKQIEAELNELKKEENDNGI